MDLEIKQGDRPREKRIDWSDLKDRLLALGTKQSLVVPLDTFNGRTAESQLQMQRFCGRSAHQRKTPEGLHVWLGPSLWKGKKKK